MNSEKEYFWFSLKDLNDLERISSLILRCDKDFYS